MAIYPIVAEFLTVGEIANHWSKEMQPRTRPFDLASAIIREWWLGKLDQGNAPSRLELLRFLHAHPEGGITFWYEGTAYPFPPLELPDGGIEIDLSPVLPVPNADPQSWSEDDCIDAFCQMAEIWDLKEFPTLAPALWGMKVSATAFHAWLKTREARQPKFWTNSNTESARVWSCREMEEWWTAEGHTNGKIARLAFMKRPDTKGLSATFITCWKNAHPDAKPGRPKSKKTEVPKNILYYK